MTSSRLYWACSGLALVAVSLLGAEIKRSDLDTLMPNRRVKAEGMGTYAIQEDIGRYWFINAYVDKMTVEWGNAYTGTTCRVQYREDGSNEVNVTIGRCKPGPWFLHDMEGEMMAKTNRTTYEIIHYGVHDIYNARMLHENEVGATWHDGNGTFVGVVTDDSTNFPAEIVSAYLKKVPSGMKKTDLYNKDYDAWRRVEIPRRIADLETLDWNAFMTESETGQNRDKWQRAALMIASLIRPVKDKTPPEDEEFFKWYTERLLKPDTMKRNGVAAVGDDLKTLRKWWEKKQDTYHAEGRKHKTR